MSEAIANTKKCAVVGVVVEHIQAEFDCDLDRTMATMADKHIYWDQTSFRCQSSSAFMSGLAGAELLPRKSEIIA